MNDVWIIDVDGSNASMLYESIPHGGPFYWNPTDSASFAFHSPRQGNFDIYFTTLGQEAQFIFEESATVEEPEPTAILTEAVAPPTESPPLPTASQPEEVPTAIEGTGRSLRRLLGWGAIAAAFTAVFMAVIYLVRRGR